jgi:hypothetical protein
MYNLKEKPDIEKEYYSCRKGTFNQLYFLTYSSIKYKYNTSRAKIGVEYT